MKQEIDKKLYKIKGDNSNRVYTAEINFSITKKTNILTFDLFSVEINDVDGNHKYYANNVKYNQIEEI